MGATPDFLHDDKMKTEFSNRWQKNNNVLDLGENKFKRANQKRPLVRDYKQKSIHFLFFYFLLLLDELFNLHLVCS